MIDGYARVSTDGQSVAAQVDALTHAAAAKVFREVASGAKTTRAQLHRLFDLLNEGDVVIVTRLDRLARSTRDLLNTLAQIAKSKAGFRSLGDIWADTTIPHGRLMLTVPGGPAAFESELIRAAPRREGLEPGGAASTAALPSSSRLTSGGALARRETGEFLGKIARSYNVSLATISRLRPIGRGAF